MEKDDTGKAGGARSHRAASRQSIHCPAEHREPLETRTLGVHVIEGSFYKNRLTSRSRMN